MFEGMPRIDGLFYLILFGLGVICLLGISAIGALIYYAVQLLT